MKTSKTVCSLKLSLSAFKYPYWSKPYLINLKLFLTFCQALIIQKSHLCQNLWSAWLTGYGNRLPRVCVDPVRPGRSQPRWRPVTGANAGARGCTGLHVPYCDNADPPPEVYKHAHTLIRTRRLSVLITLLHFRGKPCVCWIDFFFFKGFPFSSIKATHEPFRCVCACVCMSGGAFVKAKMNCVAVKAHLDKTA